MRYKGLILGQQDEVEVDTEHWKFGIVRHGAKVVDTTLHYTAFPLAYDDHGIIDKVCARLKDYKPEPGDNAFKAFEPTLNGPHLELADKLYEMSNGYRPVYTLSGSDAVEVGIKLSYAYHNKKGNKRNKIVSFDDAYHGATLLTLSCGDIGLEGAYYGMKPYTEVIKTSPDLKEDIDWSDVSCIIIETCPHYQSVHPYGFEFWEKINQIRTKHDVIIIIDDVFMGGGKTGSFFGFDRLPVKPDVFVMGKAITGGFFPLGLTMYSDKIHDQLKDGFWAHGHTYSFCLSGILCMLEYIKVLEENKYMEKVEDICQRARVHLLNAGYQVVGNYGTFFLAKKHGYHFRFCVPINADDEYFDAVPETLSQMDKRWNH